jgi:predicted amidohydrolase
MSTLKVSICTQEIGRYATLDAYVDYCEGHVSAAKAAGSDVILFPEMGNAGLLWSDPASAKLPPREVGKAYDVVLTPLFAPFQQRMSQLAVRHGIVVMAPTFWHKTDGVGSNTALIAFPDGSVRRQDKIHPTRPEQAIGTVGASQLTTFEINGVKAGLLICYDSQWPELARPLVAAGIKVLFVPSLTSRRGYWRVRYATQARAQEGQMYVCVAALFGDLGIPEDMPMTAHGRAYVTCPADNRFGIENGLYAEGPLNEDGLLTVDLDLALVDLSREKGEIRNLKDRRDDLYPILEVI